MKTYGNLWRKLNKEERICVFFRRRLIDKCRLSTKVYTSVVWLLINILFLSSCSNEAILVPEAPKIANTNQYTVSYSEALQTLQKTLAEMEKSTEGTRAPYKEKKIVSHYTLGQPTGTTLTRSANGEVGSPYVHIFNFEDNEGFAILSGDKRTAPIFAITDTGTLPEGGVVDNPGLAVFLANAEDSYNFSIANYNNKATTRTLATDTVYSNWRLFIRKTKGLSFNDWGQGFPYNDLAPVIDGQKAYTGCVATATAIIMAFYEYPSSNDGYTYNWSDMVNQMQYPIDTDCSNPATRAQIARLFQQISISKNLDISFGIGADGSGTQSSYIPRTLRNFGYSNGGSYGGYNETTITNELMSGYIAAVSGYAAKTVKKKKFLGITISTRTTYSRGHTWVLDALMKRERTRTILNNNTTISSDTETEYLVHCNWGWDGKDNGYYYSGAFNATENEDYIPIGRIDNDGPKWTRSDDAFNFQYKINAITGIRK
ncbi:MAG: C10 family peptidase [Mediterranea sp.]|jgi:hypothetical protein|nr:C10 family peptidase [Mediterranea sp.]